MALQTVYKTLTFDGNIEGKEVIGYHVKISDEPLDLETIISVGVWHRESKDDEYSLYNVPFDQCRIAELAPGMQALGVVSMDFVVNVSGDFATDTFGISKGVYVYTSNNAFVSSVVYTVEANVEIKTISFDGDATGMEIFDGYVRISDKFIEPSSILSVTFMDYNTPTVFPYTEFATLWVDLVGDGSIYILEYENIGVCALVPKPLPVDDSGNFIHPGVYVINYPGQFYISEIQYYVEVESEHDWFRQLFINEAKASVKSRTDEDLIPENVKEGVNIFGVTGSLVPSADPELQDKTVKSTTAVQTVTADEGYDGLGTVTVDPIKLVNYNISPSVNHRDLRAPEGYDGIGQVSVHAIKLQDKTVAPAAEVQTVTADEGYDGIGKVSLNPVRLQDKTVAPAAEVQTVTADEGYNGLGAVTVEGVNMDDLNTADRNALLSALRLAGADVSDDDDMESLLNKLDLFINPYEKLTGVVGETGEDKLGTYTWVTANDTPNPHTYYVLRPGAATIPYLQLDYGASYDITNITQAVRRRKMDGSYASIILSNGASRVICPETMPNAINPNGKVNTVSIPGLAVTPPVALYLPKYTANNAQNSNWIAGSPATNVQEQIVVAPEGMCWPAHLQRFTKMSADTIVAILNNLADISGTDLNFTLTLGATNLVKLTEEQKEIAYSKGWNLA